MFRRTLPAFFAPAVAVAALAAQNTIIVNDGGVQAAIDAASPGDVLLVRPASVLFVALRIDKPLAIHFDAGFQMLGRSIDVTSVPAGTSLVLQGLRANGVTFTVTNCAGSVLLAGAEVHATTAVTVRNCDDFAVEDSLLACGVVAENSHVLVHGSTLEGFDSVPHYSVSTGPGLLARRSDVGISESRLDGGDQLTTSPFDPSSPALLLDAATVRIARQSTLVAGSGLWTGDVDAIAGTGTLSHDDRIVLLPLHNGAPIASGVAASVRRIPTMAIARSAIGTTTTFTAHGEPNGAMGLLLGFPGPAFTLPGILGAGRIARFTVVTTAAFDGQGRFGFSFAVPNDPVLRAFTFRWQAVATLGANLVWSEPTSEAHS